MQHTLLPVARDLTIDSWQAPGARRAIWCVRRHGPIMRLAVIVGGAGVSGDALWTVTRLVHDCPDLTAALQVANIRTRAGFYDVTAVGVSVVVVEIGPTAMRVVRVGDGDAWLQAAQQWTPALPPLAPGAETWASAPLGRAPRLQIEACRFARHPGMRLAIANHGSGLGHLRLEHLSTWLQNDEALGDTEGFVLLSARLSA